MLNTWPWWKKCLAIVVVFALAAVGPEVMFLLDLGGLEFALSGVLLYYKPLWTRIKLAWQEVCWVFNRLARAMHTPAAQRGFWLQSGFSCAALAITGSVLLSMVFWWPGLLLLSHQVTQV